jgi:hypothetical protein
MGFLTHQNIKIIEKALHWCRNGLLHCLPRDVGTRKLMLVHVAAH